MLIDKRPDTRPDPTRQENFPQIHTVGRAAAKGREPRLLDLSWGDEAHPKVTLVGKGVAYDTGGLDIKPGHSMAGMKKDMAGAAQVGTLAGRQAKGRLSCVVLRFDRHPSHPIPSACSL